MSSSNDNGRFIGKLLLDSQGFFGPSVPKDERAQSGGYFVTQKTIDLIHRKIQSVQPRANGMMYTTLKVDVHNKKTKTVDTVSVTLSSRTYKIKKGAMKTPSPAEAALASIMQNLFSLQPMK